MDTKEKKCKTKKKMKCMQGYLNRSRSVEEVSRLFKNSFSRNEKHRYECNQACNSTNDPINILDSQNHLLTTILSTWIPKTRAHTHTHTKQV